MEKFKEQKIKNLNYLLRTYDGQTELIKQTLQRISSLNVNANPDQQDEVKIMKSLKGKLTRQIEAELEMFPVYTEWISKIKGIGPFIAGNVIMLYYYKFVPVCPDCGGEVEKKEKKASIEDPEKKIPGGYICTKCQKNLKGEGLLKYKVAEKDFPTISKWWKYMGREIKDGKLTKKTKGTVINWSPKGRVIGFMFADQINRRKPEDSEYKKFLLERKEKRIITHPEASNGHRHNMAKHETIKLFLSHFWTVARALDGKPVSEPYAGVILGHTNIIKPYGISDEIAQLIDKYTIKPTAVKPVKKEVKAKKKKVEEADEKFEMDYSIVNQRGLSTRTISALYRNDISDIRELKKYSTSKMKTLKGIGDKAVFEIKKVLEKIIFSRKKTGLKQS